ncbi:hypothetical protein STEG23_030726 [Scotinomys teguina]
MAQPRTFLNTKGAGDQGPSLGCARKPGNPYERVICHLTPLKGIVTHKLKTAALRDTCVNENVISQLPTPIHYAFPDAVMHFLP